MKITYFKSNAGFTLIEVLIAIVILTVGILGLAMMQVTAIQGNSHGRQISEATYVLSDRIERFMSLDYDDPDDLVDTDNNHLVGLDAITSPDHGPEVIDGYTLRWNVANNWPMADLKTVRLIVDPPGRAQRFSIDIIISRVTN